MTLKEIKAKINKLKKLKIDGFLTVDEKTDDFYSGQILVYEIWLEDLKQKHSVQSYKSWTVKSPEHFDWNDISYDGQGFVVINGDRYDAEEALYKVERERWNLDKSN